ncbi:MAG TPA: hypothetical protein VKZ53_14155 [Candidatus Angelobacter sp.]|nr:hypothetical protein [Candidatus Angelobacter sp.]
MKPSQLHCNFVFPRDYEVDVLDRSALGVLLGLDDAAGKLHQFPANLEEGDRVGAFLRVSPKAGSSWVGFFALGFDSEKVASGIYSTPDPGVLCAVVGGYGYTVHAAHPDRWSRIEPQPILEARAVPELKLLLFTGFTAISALMADGERWVTERLSWEGLSILEIDVQGRCLHGMGWDAITDREVPFQVDLLTGGHTGGAGPAVRGR